MGASAAHLLVNKWMDLARRVLLMPRFSLEHVARLRVAKSAPYTIFFPLPLLKLQVCLLISLVELGSGGTGHNDLRLPRARNSLEALIWAARRLTQLER